MRISIIALLLLTAVSSISQETANLASATTRQDYLKKSKSQKTAAWVLLGAGVTCFAIAAPGNIALGTAGVIIVAGGVCVLTSIPLFIASAKNKKRAGMSSAYFDLQKIQVDPKKASGFVPALSFRFIF